ncbi:MAG: HEPN domain-containing protein [Methylovulum sp.]|uniref:HEPN domain-containing protein n=1 Tax=Methylovulum sp. TaxID=1916980 RepID=UPI0026296F09|nr:HEPN domain-containing protein [Methylovulum sp.]MDD2724766.1 HEPN domain-containing protein [Methylovulum sp.]MDD5124374.1 HEPN domain-containing protein [Methylovulum sp.]
MNTNPFTQIATQDGVQYAWLRQSLNDFEMAKILLTANKWDGTCYHAQQALEKLLKFVPCDAGQAQPATSPLSQTLDILREVYEHQ